MIFPIDKGIKSNTESPDQRHLLDDNKLLGFPIQEIDPSSFGYPGKKAELVIPILKVDRNDGVKNGAGESNLNPKSVANKLRLNKQLASESQMKNPGNSMKVKEVHQAERLSKQYGGKPNDWKKMSSNKYISSDGVQFETHWFENTKTGQKVEFKTKFPKK